MIRLILSGCNGAMGRVIADAASERGDCMIVAGIDPAARIIDGFPVFSKAEDCMADADVIVDFSHPSALLPLLAMARERSLPVVVATTGLTAEQVGKIKEAAHNIPVFFSFNMSLGVNLMAELAKTATRVLGNDFDIEIVEKHHNKKIDAPSGTALMLADTVGSALKTDPQYIYDRHSRRQPRGKNEIGIHAVRGGTIVGEHEIIFAGKDEVVTISHSAMSKRIFATGALNAALFLAGKPNGLYSMSDLIGKERPL